MINLYFDSKPLTQGHAVRGIGYYTKNLLEQLQKDESIMLVDDPKEADVVHFPYFDLFFNTLKTVPGKKNIVTVFDVIPLIYPQNYPPGLRGRVNLFRQKKALKKVDAIITISETSKKDIVRFLDVQPNKVHPIHLAPAVEFKKLVNSTILGRVVEKYKLPRQFVLYVGDVNYNKNLLTLAEACLKIDFPLVVVGKQATQVNVDFNHPENKSFVMFLEKYRDNKKIIRLGFVETKDLVAIYNLATVYCQPSYYEGFGLPILEAQACGTPVVASKIQVHTEIAEGSCLFFNPLNVEDLTRSLNKLIHNKTLRNKLVTESLRQVKIYSWDKTTVSTKRVYANLL